jgi:hypothetical protein
MGDGTVREAVALLSSGRRLVKFWLISAPGRASMADREPEPLRSEGFESAMGKLECRC